MFDSICNEFIQWFETLETTFHKLVFEKAPQWFETALELGDIENAFTLSKTFKSGKIKYVDVMYPLIIIQETQPQRCLMITS